MEMLKNCAIFMISIEFLEECMKRKPDAMIALVAIFFIGLIISGFASMTPSVNKSTMVSPPPIEVSTIRY